MEINTQPVDIRRKMVLLYVPIFKIRSSKELLKLLMILKNILNGQNLKNLPQCDDMTKNLLYGESLICFDKKYQEKGNGTTSNYKIVMQGMPTHLFPL